MQLIPTSSPDQPGNQPAGYHLAKSCGAPEYWMNGADSIVFSSEPSDDKRPEYN